MTALKSDELTFRSLDCEPSVKIKFASNFYKDCLLDERQEREISSYLGVAKKIVFMCSCVTAVATEDLDRF